MSAVRTIGDGRVVGPTKGRCGGGPRRLLRWLSLAVLVAAASGASCSPRDGAAAGELPDKVDQERPEGTGPEHEGPEGSDHEHDHAAAGERSDLDQPVDELFTARCEHDGFTFECDECRYEVGVVRATAALFDGGLLELAEARREAVREPVTLNGEVRFDDRRIAHVSSLAEGVVRRVFVTLGDRVRRGQPLAEIDSVEVGEAHVSYLEEAARLRSARRNADQLGELRREGIASQRELLDAQREAEVASIRAEGARAKMARLGSGPTRAEGAAAARARVGASLVAPTDGLVLQMHAVPGEVAHTGEVLLTVGDSDAMWVWADLYERDLGLVSRYQAQGSLPASVSVKAYPTETFSGVVDFIAPTVDSVTRTAKVRVGLANPDGRLLAGMYATVRLFLPSAGEAVVVPRSAVLTDEDRTFVFVHHHDDYFVRRSVERGREFAGLVEIRAGLRGGETVVADGAFLLKSDVLRSKMGAGCAD